MIGCVHCAIPWCTLSLQVQQYAHAPVKESYSYTFVELLKSSLGKKVLGVFLVGPYETDFTNPLPQARDVIMIEFEDTTHNTTLPFPVGVCNPFSTVTGTTSMCTLVRGLAHGSMVSSQDGVVSCQPGVLPGTGTLEFALRTGEPGDSGTLLWTKTDDGITKTKKPWQPTGVFHGLRPASSHQHSTCRGIGALIPPLDKFTRLDAVDLREEFPNTSIACDMGIKDMESLR